MATLVRPYLDHSLPMPWTVKDIGASDRGRLLAISKEMNRKFDLIRTHDAIERLLYRPAQSHPADRLDLKEAMFLMTWLDEPFGGMRAYM